MLKPWLAAVAAIGSLAATAPAWAGCGESAAMKPATWSGDAAGLLEPAALSTTIVGMWSVQFFAGGNVIDFGYAQWHSDGTEIMNSGGRAPATQNFCLGVWSQTGPLSYKLNHWALSYDNSGSLNGRVNIREEVVLDPRSNTYSGPFTIDVYDPNTGASLNHVAGRVVGKRVMVN